MLETRNPKYPLFCEKNTNKLYSFFGIKLVPDNDKKSCPADGIGTRIRVHSTKAASDDVIYQVRIYYENMILRSFFWWAIFIWWCIIATAIVIIFFTQILILTRYFLYKIVLQWRLSNHLSYEKG